MSPYGDKSLEVDLSGPRASGDEPDLLNVTRKGKLWSPRERG